MPITKTSGLMVVQEGTPGVFAAPIALCALCIVVGIGFLFFSPTGASFSQWGYVFFAMAAIAIIFPRRKKLTIDKQKGQITFESFSPLGFRSPFSAPRTIQLAQVSKIVQLGESQPITPLIRGGITVVDIVDIEPDKFDLCFVLKNGTEFRERLGLSQKESAQIAEFLHVPLEKFVS